MKKNAFTLLLIVLALASFACQRAANLSQPDPAQPAPTEQAELQVGVEEFTPATDGPLAGMSQEDIDQACANDDAVFDGMSDEEIAAACGFDLENVPAEGDGPQVPTLGFEPQPTAPAFVCPLKQGETSQDPKLIAYAISQMTYTVDGRKVETTEDLQDLMSNPDGSSVWYNGAWEIDWDCGTLQYRPMTYFGTTTNLCNVWTQRIDGYGTDHVTGLESGVCKPMEAISIWPGLVQNVP